jgi:ApbE superfamily uncharacterized protein (UPF0280 family)
MTKTIETTDRTIYRRQHHGEDLIYFNVTVEQTDLHIGAQKLCIEQARKSVEFSRKQVLNEINRRPDFLTALTPLNAPVVAIPLIRQMYQASALAGTGPMAAVAGAIAEQTARDLHQFSQEVIVENGGDLCIFGEKQRIIGIYAGKSVLSNRIGVKVLPNNQLLGICTSSGTIGHSLSKGHSDAAMVIASNTALADAVATELGNRMQHESDIQKALNWAKNIKGIQGAVVIMNDKIGAVGNIELINLAK